MKDSLLIGVTQVIDDETGMYGLCDITILSKDLKDFLMVHKTKGAEEIYKSLDTLRNHVVGYLEKVEEVVKKEQEQKEYEKSEELLNMLEG